MNKGIRFLAVALVAGLIGGLVHCNNSSNNSGNSGSSGSEQVAVEDSGVMAEEDVQAAPAVTEPVDSGVPPEDTGVPPQDTGVAPADTGVRRRR